VVTDILAHKLRDFLLHLPAWSELQTVKHYRFVQVSPQGSRSGVGQNANSCIAGFSRDDTYQPPDIWNVYFQCHDVSFGAFPADRQLQSSRLSTFLLTARYSLLRENSAHCTFKWQHYGRVGESWMRDAKDDYFANNIDLLTPYYVSVNKIYLNYMFLNFLSLAVIQRPKVFCTLFENHCLTLTRYPSPSSSYAVASKYLQAWDVKIGLAMAHSVNFLSAFFHHTLIPSSNRPLSSVLLFDGSFILVSYVLQSAFSKFCPGLNIQNYVPIEELGAEFLHVRW
jgi:hypothetical protein